jgi:hypothetical protein
VIHAREPLGLTPELSRQLQSGALEQMCRVCGRWEAAGDYCSWCLSPTGPADWYRNSRKDERRMWMPKDRPASLAPEYLSEAHWPKSWGQMPRQRPPRQPQSHQAEAETP